MTAPSTPSSREKALFLSLWGIIILFVSIWWFWPRYVATPQMPTPDVELARNISPIFSQAVLTPTQAAHFQVSLGLTDDYRAQLNDEGKRVELGVRMLSGQTVLEETKAECHAEKSAPFCQMVIQNPQRLHPKRLLLYLAH